MPIPNSQIAITIPKTQASASTFLKSGSFFVPTSSIHTITAISTGSITFTPALSNYTTISSASLTWLDSSSLSPFTSIIGGGSFNVIDNLFFSNLFSFGSSTTIVTQSNSSFIFNSSSIVGASTRQFSIGFLSSSIQQYYDYTVTEAVLSLVIDDSDGSIQFQDGLSTATGITINSDTAVKGGINNRATGTGSFAVGSGSSAEGNASFTAGKSTTATGEGSFAIGSSSLAQGNASIAEGIGTLASGVASHAAGINTTASGQAAFSIGIETDADGVASFAAGSGSWARGTATVTMGIGTVASSSGQLVVGHYNETKTDINNIFVVGDGTGPLSINRRNIIEVYGGMGASFRGVKIDTAATPTLTTTINGFNVYGRSIFHGAVTLGSGVGITSIGDTTLGLSGSIVFESYNSLPALVGRTIMDWRGINFDDAFGATSPGSTYLWRNSGVNHLYYNANQLVQASGNNTGFNAIPLVVGTINASNLELITDNTTRLFVSSSGNVGIGTITPTEKLYIDGNLLVTGRITAEEFHTEFVSSSIIYQSGSTQFGNSSDDTHIFTGSLKVNGSITGSLFGTSSWAQNALTASFIDTASTNAFVQGGNSFGTTALLGTNDSQDLQFETSGSVRMTISSSGNVGIGTSTPLSTLTVVGGNINIGTGYAIGGNNLGTFSPFIRYSNTGVGIPSSSFGHTSAYMLSDAGGAFGANDLSFYAGPVTQPEIMRIVGSTGFVGIGESSPSAKLEIKGSGATSATTALRVENSNASASLTILNDGTSAFNTSHLYISSSGRVGIGTTLPTASLHISGASNSNLLQVQSPAQTNIFVVSGSGNVGIGTSTPIYRLDVSGSAGNQEILRLLGDSAVGSAIRFSRGSSYSWTMGVAAGSNFEIKDASYVTTPFTLTHTTNLFGLGTTSPSARLHVSGASNSGLFEIDSPAVNNIMYVSGSGNVGIGTGTPSAQLHINGSTILSGSLYTYNANTDIDSGSFRTIITVATSSYRAAFFDYVLTSGSNARAGTVFSVWQGTSVEYADTSTNDIGNTSGVNLLVSMSGANIGLFASSSNDNWSMKALARLI